MKTESKPIWETLKSIELILGADSLAEHFELSKREYRNLRGREKEPSLSAMIRLCQNIEVEFEDLFAGNVDIPALAARMDGNPGYLPERYQKAAFTRCIVPQKMFDFVEGHFGVSARIEGLRALQINEAAISDLNRFVNLNFTVDLISWIHRRYKSDRVLKYLGCELFSSRLREMKEMADPVMSQKETLEFFFEVAVPQRFETNIDWKIDRHRDSTIRLVGKPREEILAHHDMSCISSHSGYLVREGMLSVVPSLVGLSQAPVRRLRWFEKSKDRCEIEIGLLPRDRSVKSSSRRA